MDAGNMLKPMLARGELRMIGATTLDEYRKHIEKDPALERRFQQVFVGEPTVEDTIAILRGLKERYEVHHGVRIQDPALVAAAVLSDRYITGRFLPDKAIDLIDEAGVPPADRDRLDAGRDRRGRAPDPQLEIEKAALAEGDGPRVPGAARRARGGARRPQEQRDAMKAHWQPRRTPSTAIRALKEELEQLQAEAERAERDGDLTRAAELTLRPHPRARARARAGQRGARRAPVRRRRC